MSWVEKEQPTPFETTYIEGFSYLNGDMLAAQYHQDRLRGHKYPLITFPSGLERELRAENVAHLPEFVHLFGTFDLPRIATRDEAYSHAIAKADEHGVRLTLHGETFLGIVYPKSERGYLAVYNNGERRLVDITRYPEYAMDLLDGESRALLPPLYSTEKQGLNAVAPVKLFTPDSGWTFYATEFDGDDLFFGLVAGFEIELGHFSLSELESIRGPLGLPLERDLDFAPKPLHELKRYEEQIRGR